MENLKLENFKAVTSDNFLVNQPKRAWFEPEKLVPAGDFDRETQIKILSYCAAISSCDSLNLLQVQTHCAWNFGALGPIRRDINL